MKRIINILLLLLLVQTFTFAQGFGVDSMQVESALVDSVTDTTISDTIKFKSVRFETIRREGDKYFAVTSDNKDVEITSMINGKTRALVQDGEGHELVIDKDGNVMGVEEYKKCGGSKALLRENIKEKDSQVTKSGNVKFFSAGKYLFDTYDDYTNDAKGYAERFPSIGEGDYRPAYACAESNTKIEIKAEPYANITFKNERGVPLICKGGILEVTARGDRDTTSIYAYDADNHIVGKVNVLSYDKVTRKICLVPIGDTKAPDASAVKQGLDEIFAKLMVDFEVTIGEPITIQYAKNNKFTHGGSGMIGVYNTDQKAAISKLKERGIDNETVYLFLAECSINNQLDENDKIQVVNGYMPRGYQFGFIYNEFNNYRTDAHEICHGAFHLKHTFAQDDFLAAERTTDNLMDYNDGKTLNHWQWKDIHQPKSVRFKWLQDEEGAEAWGEIGTKILCINDESVVAAIRKYRYFYLPDGRLVDLEKYTPSGFYTEEDVTPNARGALATIRINGYDQSTIFKTDENTKEHTVTSWGYKIGDAQAMKVLDVSKVLVDNPSGINAVRVFVSKDAVRIERNGAVVETLQLSNDCHCTYKQVESECDALLEKYANSPIMQNKTLRTAILKDPCILDGPMIHFAMDVEKSQWMKEFEQVFGIAINASLLPAEIAIILPVALDATIESFTEEEIRRFVEGAVVEATMYYCVSELLEDEIDWTDFSFDVFVAGLRNATHLSKIDQATLACVQGAQLQDVRGLITSVTTGSFDNFVSYLSQIVTECGLSFVFDYYGKQSSSKLVSALQRSSMTKFSKLINKFELNQAVKKKLLKYMYDVEKITTRSSKWREETSRILTTENGAKAFDFLKEASVKLETLSAKNFERLSDIVSKLNAEEARKIVSLLSNEKDVNRMLIFIQHSGCTAEQYTAAMNRITENNLFSKTITIGGKTMSAQDFLNNYTDDLVEYYHGEDAGIQYFYKVINGEGVVVAIDAATKELYDIGCRIGNILIDKLIKDQADDN